MHGWTSKIWCCIIASWYWWGGQNVVGDEAGEIVTKEIWMMCLGTWTIKRDRETNEGQENEV